MKLPSIQELFILITIDASARCYLYALEHGTGRPMRVAEAQLRSALAALDEARGFEWDARAGLAALMEADAKNRSRESLKEAFVEAAKAGLNSDEIHKILKELNQETKNERREEGLQGVRDDGPGEAAGDRVEGGSGSAREGDGAQVHAGGGASSGEGGGNSDLPGQGAHGEDREGGGTIEGSEGQGTESWVYINGLRQQVALTVDELTYEDIVKLAGEEGTPSVTWRRYMSAEGGTLAPGEKIKMQNGLGFKVCHTGNA